MNLYEVLAYANQKYQEEPPQNLKKLRQKVIANWYRFACQLARKATKRSEDFELIYDAAVDGLIQATEKYTDSSFSFSTFAHYVITNKIKDWFRSKKHEAISTDPVFFNFFADKKQTLPETLLNLVSKIVEHASLTPMEHSILDAFMYNGNMANTVQQFINPHTGKPYTRATASLLLKKVLKKCRQAYNDLHGEELREAA